MAGVYKLQQTYIFVIRLQLKYSKQGNVFLLDY